MIRAVRRITGGFRGVSPYRYRWGQIPQTPLWRCESRAIPCLRGLIPSLSLLLVSATHVDAEEGAGEVRHEPDQPHGYAVAVEALDGLLVLP